MTRKDLSPIMQKAFDALNPEEQEEFLEQHETMYKSMISGAIVKVIARNFSHNAGKHLFARTKK